MCLFYCMVLQSVLVSLFVFLNVVDQLSQHHFLKRLSFLYCIFLPLLSKIRCPSLQSCPTLCDPITTAHQAPTSLGFSRQEQWSGLPFPSAMHESEKWKWNHSVVSDSLLPHGLQPTRLLHPWDFPGKSTGVGCHCLLHKWVYLLLGFLFCLIDLYFASAILSWWL